MMDTVPALLQGLAGGGSGNNRRPGTINDDVDGVFYDELMSYHPTHYRTPHHQPPAYEVSMPNVIFGDTEVSSLSLSFFF